MALKKMIFLSSLNITFENFENSIFQYPPSSSASDIGCAAPWPGESVAFGFNTDFGACDCGPKLKYANFY